MLFSKYDDLHELWKDFTNVSLLEECRSELELAIDSFNSSSTNPILTPHRHYTLQRCNPGSRLRDLSSPPPDHIFGLDTPFFILSSSVPPDPTLTSYLSSSPLLIRTNPSDESCFTGSLITSTHSSIFKSWRASQPSFNPTTVALDFERSLPGLRDVRFELQITFFLEFSQRITYRWPPQPLSRLPDVAFDPEHAPECSVVHAPDARACDDPLLLAAAQTASAPPGWPAGRHLNGLQAALAQQRPLSGANPFLTLLASKLECDEFGDWWFTVLRYFQKHADSGRPIAPITDRAIRLTDCLLHQKMVMVAIQIAPPSCAVPVYTADQLDEINQSVRRELRADADFTPAIERLILEKARDPSAPFAREVAPGDRSAAIWDFIPAQLFDAYQQRAQALEWLSTRTPPEVLPALLRLRCRMAVEGAAGGELCRSLSARRAALEEGIRAADVGGLVAECARFRADAMRFRELRTCYPRAPEIAERLYEDGFVAAEGAEGRESIERALGEWQDAPPVPMRLMVMEGVVLDPPNVIRHRVWVSSCENSCTLYGTVVRTMFDCGEDV